MSDMEERVRKLEALAEGRCLECGQKVKDWKTPFGAFAPEIWATLRERGIDPSSGHKEICSQRSRR